MTISLLRFSFDFAKCERYKEMGRYSFPLNIDLQPFCEQVLWLLYYLLVSLVIHWWHLKYCINNFINIINKCPFFSHQTAGEECDHSYELFSVIIHKGGCYGGHYHVYIRDIDELGQWEPQVRTEQNYKDKNRHIIYKIINDWFSLLSGGGI